MQKHNKDLNKLKQIVYKYCLRITANNWDAEDLCQDVLIKVMKALEHDPFREVTNAYLYRIALNTWKDKSKKDKNQIQIDYGSLMIQGNQDENLATRELLEILAHRLSPRAMVILLLMDVFDFTAKETAQFLSATEGAVQVTLGRVRSRLKRLARQLELDPMDTEKQFICNRTVKNEHLNFDSLVDAFRRRDAKGICKSYIGLTELGIKISAMKKVNGKLYFYFVDPDGNMFKVTS